MLIKEILLDFDWRIGITHVMNPMLLLTTMCYFGAAFSAYHAGKATASLESHAHVAHRVSYFWKTVTILLVIFGVTEFFDIQLFLTHVARQISKACGWYHQRGPFQKRLIWCFVVAAFGAFVSIAILLRRFLWQKAPALFGIAFLTGFIAVRAVSYHHVDSFLNEGLGGIQFNWILELMALFCIGASALISILQSRLKSDDEAVSA